MCRVFTILDQSKPPLSLASAFEQCVQQAQEHPTRHPFQREGFSARSAVEATEYMDNETGAVKGYWAGFNILASVVTLRHVVRRIIVPICAQEGRHATIFKASNDVSMGCIAPWNAPPHPYIVVREEPFLMLAHFGGKAMTSLVNLPCLRLRSQICTTVCKVARQIS